MKRVRNPLALRDIQAQQLDGFCQRYWDRGTRHFRALKKGKTAEFENQRFRYAERESEVGFIERLNCREARLPGRGPEG
jgi:hypothetical protein